MKTKFIILICLLLITSSLTQAKEKLNLDNFSDEEKIQIVLTLIKNHDIIFGQTEEKLGCPKGETLGNYLSRLIVLGSQGDKHSLKISCEKYNAKTSRLPQPQKKSQTKDCKLSAFTSDKEGESPWNYEIIFRASPDFKSLERAILACPGTP
jgi:hypothetical protein